MHLCSYSNSKMADNMLSGIKGKITDKMIKVLGIQSAIENTPRKLSDTIQPVLDVEPEREIKTALSNSGGVLITANPKKRTFICFMNIISGAGASSTVDKISGTLVNGETTDFLFNIASGNSIAVSLDNPIEVKPGTTVDFTRVNTIGRAIVHYYEVD